MYKFDSELLKLAIKISKTSTYCPKKLPKDMRCGINQRHGDYLHYMGTHNECQMCRANLIRATAMDKSKQDTKSLGVVQTKLTKGD